MIAQIASTLLPLADNFVTKLSGLVVDIIVKLAADIIVKLITNRQSKKNHDDN